jgi:DNA polymerase III subunit epsilon
MRLQLHKPLIIFDLETTGVIPSRDRIVELFMIKINPDGTRKELYQRFNPEMTIPAEVTAIHGITNEDVANEPVFKDKAHDIFNFIYQCDFAGFNSNKFDFPMLVEEFYRANVEFDITKCKFVDAQRIYHMMEPRTLSAAYQFYCNKPLDNAHSAKADTEATWEIIQAQIEKYQQIEPNVEYIHKLTGQGNLLDLAGRFIMNDKSQAIFNFGKHKGKTVENVFKTDPGYYDWMMQGDFSLQTKKVLTKLKLEGIK